jgi:hypothetical protein
MTVVLDKGVGGDNEDGVVMWLMLVHNGNIRMNMRLGNMNYVSLILLVINISEPDSIHSSWC